MCFHRVYDSDLLKIRRSSNKFKEAVARGNVPLWGHMNCEIVRIWTIYPPMFEGILLRLLQYI